MDESTALTCVDCATPMKRTPKSRPQGQARCHKCRREHLQRKPHPLRGSCARCGKPIHISRTSLPQGQATCLTCRRANPAERKRRHRCAYCTKPVERGSNSLSGGRAACADCRRSHNDPDMVCKLCATCAQPLFVSLDSQLFCSERCRQWWKNRSSVRRRVNAMRDAALRGKDRPAESFDPIEIFQRDGWRCQACGIRTKRTARFPDKQAPTLDHIVPLSKGGEHTRANTRCVCFSCNCAKGDRPTGDQLRLIG